MFLYLRLKKRPRKITSDTGRRTLEWLMEDAIFPVTLKQINDLPKGAVNRAYRALLPPTLLAQFNIDPITWKGRTDYQLLLNTEAGVVKISIRNDAEPPEDFFCIQLSDNAFNGIDLDLLLLSDPGSSRFNTDFDKEGRPTSFGTVRRNIAAEERAMQAGLAPGQVRMGLGASNLVLQHLEGFLATCGHSAYFLEPLTYVAAWVYERRGFAYVRGHKLMDDIHREFQSNGRLNQALDGSTPFRRASQNNTVRGRAWAIHDNILEAVDARWDKLRMIKRVGRHAGIATFPEAVY